jgi:hypothetical protein
MEIFRCKRLAQMIWPFLFLFGPYWGLPRLWLVVPGQAPEAAHANGLFGTVRKLDEYVYYLPCISVHKKTP